ncbi:hypothetical protein [Clostridium vincentii]|uniref:Uncharacterized protein n=1 Tax=Clostridium vincentii TaxID=52704 RepID=A0A2T0BAM8_9CLOT|nr:hypothetical protein [Clostridium vincentii]PRR80951.1 hypothetical protein CLVI_28620 [Clostridium vincentii]
MKKTISPLLVIGLLIVATHSIMDRFFTPMPNWLAIPLLVVAIILIVVGGLKSRKEK